MVVVVYFQMVIFKMGSFEKNLEVNNWNNSYCFSDNHNKL